MRLTRDEVLLIAGLLGALVMGATVRHYRDLYRATFDRSDSVPKVMVESGNPRTSRPH